ncbi:hypothetical protein [Peribacillus sp. TH27]|nr:hypothetical protein [Peribacillus sp. TH27]MBK5458933.1 hypothetical protein [Peribacillus sp. TH27]
MKSIFVQLKLPGSNTYKVVFKRKDIAEVTEAIHQLEFDFDSLEDT